MYQRTRIAIMRLSCIFAKVLNLGNMGTLRKDVYARDDNAIFIFWDNGSLNSSPSGWIKYVWTCTYKVNVLCWTFKQSIKRVCTEHGSAKGFNGNWILNGWDIRANHWVHGSIPTIKNTNMGFGQGGRCLWGDSRRCIHSNIIHSCTTKHGTQLCFQQHKHHGPLGEVRQAFKTYTPHV